MVVEGQEVPEEVLLAEEKAKDHAAPHVNFYDPSVYKVNTRLEHHSFYAWWTARHSCTAGTIEAVHPRCLWS